MKQVIVIIVSFLCCFSNVFGQNDSIDSTHFFYHREIKYDGADLEVNGNYIYLIEEMVNFMKENPKYHLHIRGHVCCGPNKRISKKRAYNVFKIFIQYGIEEERLSYKGYSNEAPKNFPEKKEEDEIANRRVDFLFCIPN